MHQKHIKNTFLRYIYCHTIIIVKDYWISLFLLFLIILVHSQ